MQPKKIISKKAIILLLLLVMIFFTISNYIFLKDTPNPIGRDSLIHLRNSTKIIRDFYLGIFLNNPISVYHHTILYDKDYPPLYYIIAAILRTLINIDFMFMTSTLFLILLLYSTYKIGTLIKDEITGLLSAIFITLYPIVYLTSLHFNLELAQAAAVCFALYLLLKSDYFKNRKYSILFGLMFAIGMLIKQQVIIFIIGPLFITSFFSLLVNFKKNRTQLINLIFALLIFSLITFLFFYWIYLDPERIKSLIIRSYLPIEFNMGSKKWFNLEHLLFYFKSLKMHQVGLFNLVLFLISVPIFYQNTEYKKYRSFFAIWLILPISFLTFIPAKFPEYTISYLPVFALITSLGILAIKHKIIKVILVIVTLLFNIFIYINFVYPDYTIHRVPDQFLNYFRKFLMPADIYSLHNSKTLDPGYKTVKFLTELQQNRESTIGLIHYRNFDWSCQQIKNLLLLYTPYEVKDIIFDFSEQEQDLEKFDFIIFTSAPGRNEEWLNMDYFIQDISEINKFQITTFNQQVQR